MYPHGRRVARKEAKDKRNVVRDQSETLEELFHSRQTREFHRCITFRSASIVKPLISMQKVARLGTSWCWISKEMRTFEMLEMER